MIAIAFRVYGTPAPQGSKRHVGNGVMVESSAKVRPWRQDVKYAALAAHEAACPDRGSVHFLKGVPVVVAVRFYLPRPRSHYRSGANVHLLRDAAPKWPSNKPDLDKLARSTLDALGEAGIFHDDSQVAHMVITKDYADHLESVGAGITIQERP